MLPYGDAIPAGVLVHRGGTVVYANATFCKILGLDRERVVGRSFQEFLSPDEARRVMERYARRARGEPVPTEYEVTVVRGSDGARRVVEIDVNPSGDDVVVLVRDVTDVADRRARRLALAQLGATLQAHHTEDDVKRALREGATALGLRAAWMVPADDDRLRVEFADLPDGGAAFEAALGRRIEGWTGAWTSWFRRAWIDGEAYADDAVAEVARFIGQPWEAAVIGIAAANGLTRGIALRVDLGGEPCAMLVLRGAWLREDDLPIARLLGAQISAALDNARFIAGAESRVRELEALHELARCVLRETSKDPTTLLRAAARIARAALGAESAAVLLLSPDGATFEHLTDEPHPGAPAGPIPVDDVPLVVEALATQGCVVVDELRTDRRTSRHGRTLNASGPALLVALRSGQGIRGALTLRRREQRFTDADQAFVRAMVGVVEVGLANADLYAEAQLRLRDLEDAQGRLLKHERLAALGEVAAVVAHEVRNPLAVIFNAVSALRRLVPREGDAGLMINTVREEAERLNQIVGDLLGFARPVAPNTQPERLAPLVESALAAAFAKVPGGVGGSHIAVTLEVSEALPSARIDARLMRQALINLLINAIEAMPSGGELRVRAALDPEGERLRLSVTDTGTGIADDVRARIFEPFYTTRAAGTGLGLAVVKRIVEAHGGEVLVEAGATRGTTFTLVVPVAE